jgi:hypothetical protein
MTILTLKYPRLSAGFEPANLGSRGKIDATRSSRAIMKVTILIITTLIIIIIVIGNEGDEIVNLATSFFVLVKRYDAEDTNKVFKCQQG